MNQKLFHWGFCSTFCVVLALGGLSTPGVAQQFENEEVLFFDGRPDQTVTEKGGTVIFPVESRQWRFWFRDVYHAAVSPNGRKVVYRYQNSINITDLDGQNPKTIAFDMPGTPISWSPSGDRIAFYMSEALMILDLEGNVMASHSHKGSSRQWLAPSWSPDGTKIAVTDTGSSDRLSAYILDVVTGSRRMLYDPIDINTTTHVTWETLFHPLWSPRGDQIAVVRSLRNDFYRGGLGGGWTFESSVNVALIPVSGGAPKLLTSFPTRVDFQGPREPINPKPPLILTMAWSPDGSELAYSVNYSSLEDIDLELGLYRISANGGSPRRMNGFVPGRTYAQSIDWSAAAVGGKPTALQWTILNPTGFRVEILLPSPYGQVGEPMEAMIKLTSLEEVPITVEFPNGLLTTNDEELFEITVDEIETVELTPEEPVVTFPAIILPKKFGAADLTVDAQAVIDGELEILQVTETLTVPPLLVTLKALPLIEEKPIVNMVLIKGEEEGEVVIQDEEKNVIEPKVEVTLKNLSDESVTALLQGVDPRARDDSAVLGRIKTLGEFPVELGTLEPGEEKVHEVDLSILEDGRFEFVATVTGFYQDKPEATFAGAKRGAPIAVGDKYPVTIEIEFATDAPAISGFNNGAFIVQPGGAVPVVASVNNQTSNSTLEFYGIQAKKTLNVQGAHLTSEEGRAYNAQMPFVHDHSVDANSSVILGGGIFTSKDGAGSGLVEWQGLKDAKLIDDKTGEEQELKPDDILITSEPGGWLGDPLMVRVIQDRSRPAAPPISAYQAWSHYSEGVMIGMGDWLYDSFDAIGGIGRVAGYISADPTLFYNAVGETSRALYEIAQLVGETWSEMSAEEKEEFVLSVVGEVQRRLFLLATTRSPLDAEDSQAVLNWTREATFSLFGGVEAAYASDDPAQLAEMFGRVSGHVAMEVITAAVSEIKLTKYVKGAEFSKRAKNKSLGPALNEQEEKLRALKSGPLDDSTVLAAFGPGSDDLRLFEKVFRAFKVKGYARERNPLSYALINLRKVAVWKPENMKPKGISDIDLILLGKNHPVLNGADGQPVNLEAVTGVYWPGKEDEVKARLKDLNLSEEVEKACLERAAKRREEFHEYIPKFQEWADGDGIPVSPNLADNGVANPTGQGDLTREFQVEVIIRDPEDGPTLYIPKMANQAGELRYISGDIDWVHFSFLDGSPLDPDTAYHLYTTLMRCCGMQHPETVTWINKGQSVFKGKINQLAEYVRGEKALLEVSGEGARAVRISERFTRFADGLNARNHLIVFSNGILSRQRATLADIESAAAKLRDVYQVVVVPFLWDAKIDDPVQAASTIGGKGWTYTAAEDGSVLLRQRPDGGLEAFNGQTWLPWTPPADASQNAASISVQQQNDDQLSLSPLTLTEADAKAGDDTLLVFDLPSLWPSQLEGHVEQWFDVGAPIVIAPGELAQEVRTVIGLAPLTLDFPLLYDHPKGTTVAVIPAGMTVTEVSDTASPLIRTVNENGLTTLIWSSVPGYRYDLEYENSPGGWIVLQMDLDSDGNAIPTTLPTNEHDPDGNYRLRKLGAAPQPLKITSFTVDPTTETLTLSWTQHFSNAYLVEVSETLNTGSWGALLPEYFLEGTDAWTTLPMNSTESARRFYRIRSSDFDASSVEESIIAMDYNVETGVITVSWATVPNEEYLLESTNYQTPGVWQAEGEVVTATGASAFLTIPAGADTHSRVYRVRRIE